MTNALRRTRTCKVCHQDRPHQGRGLCSTCYDAENRNGRLDQWPPLGRTRRVGPVVLERLHRGEPVTARHPDDRAAVVEANLAGQITRTVALRTMNCNTYVLDATIRAARTKVSA